MSLTGGSHAAPFSELQFKKALQKPGKNVLNIYMCNYLEAGRKKCS